MTSEQYKQMIIHDIIVDKINSITLEQRLNNLIMFAQNERAMEINKVLFPDSVIGDLITEPESIKPEDMVKGEWYVLHNSEYNSDYLFKHKSSHKYPEEDLRINYYQMKSFYGKCLIHSDDYLHFDFRINTIRKATREEVIKYFPNEFDKEIAPHNIE